ncbi:hypothetical protein FQN57_001498 [Myotisia sp. PD_48]|nr:hypothetical protein FQN57_001498 [Myotisia sp. PD_48]
MVVGNTLPQIAPLPPPSVLQRLPESEQTGCLDAWIMSIDARLRMSTKEFEARAPKDESVQTFLQTYFARGSLLSSWVSTAKAFILRRLCFLLTRRLLLAGIHDDLDVIFLGNFCACYHHTLPLKSLLLEVWNDYYQVITLSIDRVKKALMHQLSDLGSETASNAIKTLRTLTVLSSTLPQAGTALMTGSDYLDTIFEAYSCSGQKESLRRTLVAHIYVSLLALMKIEPPATSLLLDQLYSLKVSARLEEKIPRDPTLLSALVCSTNFIKSLDGHLARDQQQKRGDSLIASLRAYRSECKAFHTPYQRIKKKVDKGKGRAPSPEFHIHKMSLVTQVQDLFPDLGSGYIVKLLSYYGDEIEVVISHLIEDSLPSHLKALDQTEQLPEQSAILDISPRNTPPSSPAPFTRKNVFDDDDFDRLAIRSSQLNLGRANPDLTADALLADKSNHAASKAAILSALAAFDADDDERDDTYDVADVGGTVDTIHAGVDADTTDKRDQEATGSASTEMKLFELYKSNPASFARDSTTRRSQHRSALRKETGMTDEAIEGWAVMLSRDPKQVSRLQSNLTLYAGLEAGSQQPQLPSTAYRKAHDDSEPDDRDSGAEWGRHSRGRGQTHAQRGARGGARGAKASPTPAEGPDSSAARRRKDANKASRANHNRRNQRAKKMARGGI